jgi:collagenase-like protein with putative collagen-binding domain
VLADHYFYHPGSPYQRTGPGSAEDGKPRFNLELFDETYFERLRSRVVRAGERGIYVAIMLFNGWSTDDRHAGLSNPWRGHPFNRANNVNDIDGDPNHDGNGDETHQLLTPEVTAYQERYTAKVVQTVNDLDNVLWEVSNESFEKSRAWQYHMIRFIRALEAKLPKQHPIGMTSYLGLRKPTNVDLFESPADWVSPNRGVSNEYATEPPPASGEKVVVLDTDHIWGIGGDWAWAWKSFLRGYNLLFMDAYDGTAVGSGAPADFDIRHVSWKTAVKTMTKKVLGLYQASGDWNPNAEGWVSLRSNLGHIRGFATRVDLGRMLPQIGLSSTGYCLAGIDGNSANYLVYRPQQNGEITLDLSACDGLHEIKWFDPRNGRLLPGGQIDGGQVRTLQAPFEGDAVAYVYSSRCGFR